MDSMVYFIQCGSSKGPIKVGVSNDIDKRIETLQIGCPWRLKLIAKIKPNSDNHAYYLEGQLHNKFKRHHMRGEWFKSKIILNLIDIFGVEWVDNEAYAMAAIPGRFKDVHRGKGRN